MRILATGIPARALRLLLLAALLTMCGVPARGQGRSHAIYLKLTVVSDSDGQPVPGASCLLKDYGIFAMADLDGLAILEKVPAGKATLEIQMLGYEDYRQTCVFMSAAQSLRNWSGASPS